MANQEITKQLIDYIELAQNRGAYTLRESAIIYNTIVVMNQPQPQSPPQQPNETQKEVEKEKTIVEAKTPMPSTKGRENVDTSENKKE